MIWLDNGLICELIDLIVPLIKRMNAVGKLGSYISRGVVTVSAPFHPFGGAVDIVVVEQEDGSLKSSPWYVQFGKFQGVLKAREKVVTVNVNGVDADFRMYLDNRGGAHFLREIDGDEEMSESIGSSGGDNKDGSSCIRTPQKNMSCNNELQQAKLVSEFGASSQKKLSRSISTGPRVLGFVFGRRSWKENRLKHQENVVRRDREGSLERAEMAADLLEVRWSTSLATRKHRKDSTLRNSSIHHEKINEMDICRLSPQSNGFHDKGEAGIPMNYMESFTLKEAYLDLDVFESLVGFNGVDTRTNSNLVKAGVGSNGDEQSSTAQALQSGDEKRMKRVESIIYCEASERFIDDGSSGESSENLCFGCSVSGEMDVPAEVLGDDRELISKMDSEFSSSTTECKMGMDRDNPEDKDPCRSIDMSKSDSATSSDIENVLETEVDVVVECKANESPVKFVEEIVVNQTPPSSKNSFLLEEATSSILDSKENSRSQKLSSPTSSDLDHLGSYEERKSQDLEVSSEDNVGLLAKNPDNTQFNFSDFNKSECTKTMDTHPIALDSLEAENDLQYHPKCSEEKLTKPTGVLDELHSFTGQLIQEILPDDHPSNPEMSKTVSRPISIVRNHELADQTAQTVKSLPRFWSHEAEIDAQGSNCLVSRSLDSNLDNLRLAQGDFPTALENGEQKQQSIPRHSSMEHMHISEELRKILSDPAVEISLCRHILYKGMGQEAAAQAFDSGKLDLEKLVSLGSEILRNDRLVVRIGGLYFPWDAALPIISAIGSPTGEQILEPKGMISVDQVENGIEWDPTQSVDSKLATAAQQGTGGTTDTLKTASIKKNKMVWSKTPTSEQLASLNLKEGRNEVTFTFLTPMLGEQKVDARIYLWKWNVRIVISDVDGTITKSDVLGQFMPLVGVDWSHIGVAHLFSAIKENGYELLFLSARAISQASLTRQFLFNLKQDGKALPEGPVFISPDGLLPSLIREVIRRAPHEFKIACLEDIRALFPPHHNPFYAGFGNRDTDELSYLKVGIPKGKIFIINPKGEVAVQRRVDRKTYTSLHTLVHDMFPPSSSVSSSEQEDFNSWNFWRLPAPETVV